MPLFVYGSLQVPKVLEVVIGRPIEGKPASAPGFRRFVMKGYSFPGMIPEAEASTGGRLIEGLTEEDLERLDHFEGEPYLRQKIRVLLDGNAPSEAWAYVIPAEETGFITDLEWDLQKFIDNDLEVFLGES